MTAEEKVLFYDIWKYYVYAFPVNLSRLGEKLEKLKNKVEESDG